MATLFFTVVLSSAFLCLAIREEGDLVVGGIVAAFFLLGGAVAACYFRIKMSEVRQNIEADLDSADVAMVSGRAHLSVNVERRDKVAYTLTIGDQAFALTKQEFYGFKQNDPYIVYYAPCSQIILSAEPLEPLT